MERNSSRYHDRTYYEEAGTSNLSGRQWFFLGRVAGLPGVSISGIPYQGEVEESDRGCSKARNGRQWKGMQWGQADPHFHEDKFYVSMRHMESCKTVCGSKEIDQTCPHENGDREGIV